MSPLFSQFSTGGARRTVGAVSGVQGPDVILVNNRSLWQSNAVNGVPIGLYNWQTNAYDVVIPANSPRGQVGYNIGNTTVPGTSWPGNNQNRYWNRNLDNSTYQQLQRYGPNFTSGYLVWNSLSGQNESCCDPNWVSGGFGGFISEGPQMRGSWNSNYTSPITSSSVGSNDYSLRYRTDGSVNTGPGFYTTNTQMWLEPN